jgi:hypothetical protein
MLSQVALLQIMVKQEAEEILFESDVTHQRRPDVAE